MKKAKWVSVALFALTVQALELDLYYRSKGRFREKRRIMYADLALTQGSGLFAHLSLGTPPQNFCVIVDTFLDFTVLISSTAHHADWNDKSKFNRRYSTTDERLAQSVSVKHVLTTPIRDIFKLNGIPPIRVTFSVTGSYNPRLGVPVAGDGHLGLGYPDMGRRLPDFNILNVLSENQLIDYKRLTLLCVCAAHRNDLEPDAQVVFGSHHKIYPEEFQMVPADINRGGWKLVVLGLGTQAGRISSITFTASLDSTAWLSRASVDRARLINTALGARESGNLYFVDCNRMDQLPTLIISFQDQDLSLSPEQYFQKENIGGRIECFGSIAPDPEIRSEDMVLGMTFMEHFLTMFDQEAKGVGFQPRVC
ncbi:hypothetical protein CRM22_001334 [Opisthorchis felineus]|uniref:Peptidase A1 domain-containing protein n=1 Tax=Opisthorchis felineus TaxID=147828 RepID=A0A4S2MB31_OPIFE|nr:hypothetical protein CRM22_001334 [Opisthorchis felineus]